MLSVIIPARDAAATIGLQLEALAAQDYAGEWEVIVADNGSTDATRAVVAGLAGRVPGLRLVDASDRPGPAHARNVGAREARGGRLLFLDADDEVAPGFVAAMARALDRNALVAARMDTRKLNPREVAAARPNPQASGLATYDYPPFLPHAAGASLGVRRELHEAIGGFDEEVAIVEDCDYCWRLQLRGVELAWAPDALLHYRHRSGAAELFRQALAYGQANVLLYERYRRLGMPPLSRLAGPARWAMLLLRLPRLARRETRLPWLWSLGWRTGRLVGSVRRRVWALTLSPVLAEGAGLLPLL